MTNDATTNPSTCPELALGARGDIPELNDGNFFAYWHRLHVEAGTYTFTWSDDTGPGDTGGGFDGFVIITNIPPESATVGAITSIVGEEDDLFPPPVVGVWDGVTMPYAFAGASPHVASIGSETVPDGTPGLGYNTITFPVAAYVYISYGAFNAGAHVYGHTVVTGAGGGGGPSGPVGVQRWTFRRLLDDELITLDYNPDGATSFDSLQATTTSPISPIDGLVRATRTMAPPKDASFTGFIRTQAQHDRLVALSKEKTLFELTDHLGKTYLCRFIACDIDEQKPTKRTGWRLRYTMRMRSYGASS
jgi:hypothetical protein